VNRAIISSMPSSEIRAQVAERLEELYQRHLPVDSERVVQYYESGRGYYGPD